VRGAIRRRRSGVVWVALAVAGLIALLVTDAPRWTRLMIAIPAGLAAVGFLQARERT
jgi:threonine/homoserine efflux transporter RhtA